MSESSKGNLVGNHSCVISMKLDKLHKPACSPLVDYQLVFLFLAGCIDISLSERKQLGL